MTDNLLQFTINVPPKSHRQPHCAFQLVYEDRVLFVRAELRFSLCSQQHPKCEREIRLVFPPFFCIKSAVHPTPQPKI